MQAKLLPLDGKYYGTIVGLEGGSGITVWVMRDAIPSKRQLEYWGVDLQQAQDDDYLCDSHFETETSYQIALKIVEAVKDI